VIKTALLVLLSACGIATAFAQLQQMQPPRFAAFYIETGLQPKQDVTDSPGYTYSLNSFRLGMVLPLLSKKIASSNDSLPPNRLGLAINPSLGYSRMKLSYYPQERLLLNHQVTLSTYYFFRQKNALLLNVRALYNEDEFTIKNPELRYNFSLLYTRKATEHFSYYAGGAYSYLFGEGLLLPLLGARFSWGSHSRLNILLPFQVSYRTYLGSNTRLMIYAHPEGGVNRFENRLNINDSLQKVVVFRRRSVALGAAFTWQVKSNVSVVIDPAFLFAQHISFTADGERKGHTYIDNMIYRSFQLQLKLIWRPWQNSMRNQKKVESDLQDDDNFILGF
jgi:hypothetical protein